MDEMSAHVLNDSLISSDLFKCKHCLQILTLPIMYIKEVGNICGSCFTTTCYQHIDNMHNYEMEEVLLKLFVPCKFEKKGCTMKSHPNDIAVHESVCEFHNLICPYTYFKECSTESIANIVEHFEEAHTHSIITTEGDTIKLSFHVSTSYNRFNLLVIGKEKFLLHIVRDLDDDRVHYLMYYLGKIELVDNFQCMIEHCSDNMKIEANTALLPESSFNPNHCDKTKATSFNMTFLQELFKDNINICIRIMRKSDLSLPCTDNYEKILSSFECPVCNGYMRPPIFQCLSGHSICDKCKAKVAHCPTCRSSYGSTRNYVLENLCSNIRYPCVYKELGCQQYFLVNEITRHENECAFKSYGCPFSEHLRCTWTGSLYSAGAHLQTAHPEHTMCDCVQMENISYAEDQQFFHMKALVAYGRVFRLCHQRHIGNQNAYWSVQVMGARGDGKKYTCQVGLIDMLNHNKQLIRTDNCEDMTTQDFMFNKCIVIPLTVVSGFSAKGRLQFYYKVVNSSCDPHHKP